MNTNKRTLRLEDLDSFVLDFDGVLTNNLVHLDQYGKEWVSCNRSDGLAFDVLRKLEMKVVIMSTEKNPVVSARAKKLRIEALQGVESKEAAIRSYAEESGYSLDRIFYVGNDLNDYKVMKICGLTACPGDSHPQIKQISDFVLNANGGGAIMRELLEDVLEINFIKVLYGE